VQAGTVGRGERLVGGDQGRVVGGALGLDVGPGVGLVGLLGLVGLVGLAGLFGWDVVGSVGEDLAEGVVGDVACRGAEHEGQPGRVDAAQRGGEELQVGEVGFVGVLHDQRPGGGRERADQELDEAVGDPPGPQACVVTGALGGDRHRGEGLAGVGDRGGEFGCRGQLIQRREDNDVVRMG